MLTVLFFHGHRHIKVSIGDPNDDTGAGYVSVINGGKGANLLTVCAV